MARKKAITPSSLVKHVQREAEAEPPYSWTKQARRQSVDLKFLAVKQTQPTQLKELPVRKEARSRPRKKKA
jgi:hypothetical protein